MRAETYAIVNLAALNLIEAVSAAYFVTEKQATTRHEFRAREMLKKIALALDYDLTEAAIQADRQELSTGIAPRATVPALRLVSAEFAERSGD